MSEQLAQVAFCAISFNGTNELLQSKHNSYLRSTKVLRLQLCPISVPLWLLSWALFVWEKPVFASFAVERFLLAEQSKHKK